MAEKGDKGYHLIASSRSPVEVSEYISYGISVINAICQFNRNAALPIINYVGIARAASGDIVTPEAVEHDALVAADYIPALQMLVPGCLPTYSWYHGVTLVPRLGVNTITPGQWSTFRRGSVDARGMVGINFFRFKIYKCS